jgi:hypothetical protein
MRRIAALSVLALVATWVTVVAFDAGTGGIAPAGVALAQDEGPVLDYSHVEIPFFEAWVNSGHADITSEAFTHWNEDDPPLVSESCATCHSAAGHKDFIGLDGSPAGQIDAAAEPGVIECSVCHNPVSVERDSITMPSGVVVGDLGREATCMTCHQGRASGDTVRTAIEEAGVGQDEVMEAQGFINIHYYAAAATLYGSEAGGGFQYEGEYYDPRFEHVEGYDSCQSCHDPHSLELRVESCAECHRGVETVEDLREIRFAGSLVDYDGDGDITTGIATEIDNLQHMLYDAIQAYAADVVGTGVVYDSHAYPYFFTDSDGDGEVDADEANYGNRYGTWTPRLLAAAYNYQATKKDPGGYAHNAKYTIQLLHDSILDLTGAMGDDSMAIVRPTLDASPADENAVLAQASSDYDHSSLLSTLPAMSHGGLAEMIRRNDAGHFDGSTDAWRHWDEDGAVSASCATCHSADGLPFKLEHDTQIEQEIAQGMECTTCHVGNDDFALLPNEDVTFPSGATLTFEDQASNICAECHQGRNSTDDVDARIGDLEADMVGEDLGFVNVHYFATAATRFGGEARGGYQYAGKEYVGYFPHVDSAASCVACHDPHNQQIDVEASCAGCHGDISSVAELRDIREFFTDSDGNGNTDEGTYYEIQNMNGMLYDAIQSYASDTIGTPIIYDSHSYPYFFTDTDADGEVDADEANYGNQYGAWTPRLLRAAYNYQYVAKDPGGYAHNSRYVLQLLYDSLEDLGVDVSAMERPAADLY